MIDALCQKAGMKRTASVQRAFSVLEVPGAAYVVAAGELELYTVRIDEKGRLAGGRTYLYTAQAGELVLAPAGAQAGGLAMAALAEPGTELWSFQMTDAVEAAGADEQACTEWARLLNGWLDRISAAAAAQQLAPRQSEQLRAGEDEERVVWLPSAFVPEDHPVWVRAATEPVYYWGDRSRGEDAALRPVLVTRSAWIWSGKGNRLQVYTMEQQCAQAELAEGLAMFHRLMLGRLEQTESERRQSEQRRVQQRQEQDAALMKQAARRFSAVADRQVRQMLLGEGVEENPLAICCILVGQELGIRIVIPSHGTGHSLLPEEIFRESGVRSRKVALRGTWQLEDNGPLLGCWEDGTPVALLPRKEGGYIARCSLSDEGVRVTAELAVHLQPFAHQLYRPLPARALQLRDMLRLMMSPRMRADLIKGVVLGLLLGGLGLCIPAASGLMIDQLLPMAQVESLYELFVLLCAVAAGIFGFTISQSITWLRVFSSWDASLQSSVWDRLLNMPLPFFRRFSSGDLAARMTGVSDFFRILSGWLLSGMAAALFSVLQVVMLFIYVPELAWTGIAICALYLLFFAALSFRLAAYTTRKAEEEGKVSGLLIQLLSGIAKLRVAAAERRAFHRWSHAFTLQRAYAFKLRETGNLLQIAAGILPIAASLLLFWMVERTGMELQPGQFAAFHAAYATLIGAVTGLCVSSLPLFELAPLYRRMKPLLDAQPEADERRANPGSISGRIELNEVTFRYQEEGPPVLDRLSLHIEAGEYVAVVGASGSGKSTLLRMLIGFERPQTGAVYYDGLDMEGLDLLALRRQCGVVLQNGSLWSGDLAQNIIGQEGLLTVEDAWTAAQMVGMDEEIAKLPMGMHTVLSDTGGLMSGGQKQRILIARAIVHKPRVVLLDEATSALDQVSQEKITVMLKRMKATRIVIAHRLSTIREADRILVMESGRIVEEGTYEQLLHRNGLFAAMASRQVV